HALDANPRPARSSHEAIPTTGEQDGRAGNRRRIPLRPVRKPRQRRRALGKVASRTGHARRRADQPADLDPGQAVSRQTIRRRLLPVPDNRGHASPTQSSFMLPAIASASTAVSNRPPWKATDTSPPTAVTTQNAPSGSATAALMRSVARAIISSDSASGSAA